MTDRLVIAVVSACWLWACSHDVATGTRCKSGTSCAGLPGSVVGVGGSGVGAQVGDVAPVKPVSGDGRPADEGALSVQIENIQQMKLELITLACAGDCADIVAVARGGNPPYALQWDDGSSDGLRHVCLDASKTLSVSATDTAIHDVEFGYEAHTVSTEVTAQVLDCGHGVPGECASQPSCAAGKYSGRFAGNNVMSGSAPTAGDPPQSGTVVFTLIPSATSANGCALDAGELDVSDDASSMLGSPLTASRAHLAGSLDCATGSFDAKSIDGTWLLLGIDAGPFDTTLSGSLDSATQTIRGNITCNAGARSIAGTFSATRVQ